MKYERQSKSSRNHLASMVWFTMSSYRLDRVLLVISMCKFCIGWVNCGRCVGLTIWLASVCRLSRQCGILNTSQPYRPPRPVTGIALLLYLFFIFYELGAGRTIHYCVLTKFNAETLFACDICLNEFPEDRPRRRLWHTVTYKSSQAGVVIIIIFHWHVLDSIYLNSLNAKQKKVWGKGVKLASKMKSGIVRGRLQNNLERNVRSAGLPTLVDTKPTSSIKGPKFLYSWASSSSLQRELLNGARYINQCW
jgi:hypothetical protein